MDYGHPLEFGTFITPANSTPQTPVALARLSEQLGYDLVTFQDHPYQPRFLDTWTLMTWVAAQTERIRIAANVLNLPMRPPAVLARAAASLDLLSKGPLRPGAWCRRLLGCDGSDGRAAADPGRVGGRIR